MRRVGILVRTCLLVCMRVPRDALAQKLTLGGYIETFYQLSFAAPSNHITNLRGFDNHERTFMLSNVALDANAERGPVTTHIIFQIGATPTAYYGAELEWKYIQLATVVRHRHVRRPARRWPLGPRRAAP